VFALVSRLLLRPVVRMVVVGIVVLAIQTTVLLEIKPFGVTLQLMLLLGAVSGVVAGPERGALAGFLFGVLLDLTLTTPLGVAALAGGLAGYVAGFAQSVTVTPPWWLTASFVGIGSAVGELAFPVVQALVGKEGWIDGRLVVVVPVVAIANACLGPLLVPIARWWSKVPRPV
jgi:rod shape-determining protein MreD